MNKRGQFYIIMAIVVSLIIYSLYLPENKIEEVTLFEDFRDISLNYQTESPKVVNHYIYKNLEDEDLKNAITNFTSDFLEQIQQKNPNVNLVFFLSNGTHVFIKSYFDNSILFQQTNTTKELFGENQESLNSIKLKVSGKDFEQQVPVKMKNFGNEFTSQTLPLSDDEFVVEIGTIFHNFQLNRNNIGNEFIFLIEANNGNITNIYTSGTNPYNVRF